MKLERNEFMLCVEVFSDDDIEPPYKEHMIIAIDVSSKNLGLDKQYSVKLKPFIKMLWEQPEDQFVELYRSIKAYWGRRDQDYSLTGERRSVHVTADNYASIKTSLKRFLILEIEKYAIKTGSIEKLGLKLGQSEKYAQMALKRGSFSALERLWRECREKIDGIKSKQEE